MLSQSKHPAARRIFAFSFRYARFFDALRMTRIICISPCVMLSLSKHPAAKHIFAFSFHYARFFDTLRMTRKNKNIYALH